MALIRAWACRLRSTTAWRQPAGARSSTNCPRPASSRGSSLRRTSAPTYLPPIAPPSYFQWGQVLKIRQTVAAIAVTKCCISRPDPEGDDVFAAPAHLSVRRRDVAAVQLDEILAEGRRLVLG